MNPYHEGSQAETPSELGEIETPTSSTSIYSPQSMADSAGAPQTSGTLQVDPTSKLAGYTYEESNGRYATFFWQRASDDSTEHSLNRRSASIYSSTFYKTDSGWTLVDRPVLVALDAKKQSPLAAVTWSNGLNGAVYYLNEKNIICERVTTDSGKTWNDGLLARWTIPTRNNSDLAAVVTWESLRSMEIYVYFQEVENRIRELRFASEKGEWYEDSPNGINHLKGLSGTSIACAADSAPNNANRWMYSQSTSREVQGCIYEANGKKWTYDNPNKLYYFTQNFDRKVRLEFCADRWFLRIYAHDGSKALEKVCQREGCKWKDQITLPMGTGAAKIKQNFIVLRWPQDVDNTTSEVHLFSTDGGILHDYLIGPSTGGEFSLV